MKQRTIPLAFCALLLLSGCQSETVQEEIWEMEAEAVVTFADGETVDRWRGYVNGLRENMALYELSDGTVLLIETDTAGPEAGDLDETAQQAILSFYQQQGLRYDVNALLGQAYARCQQQGGDYEPGHVGQETARTAASERAVYYTVTVTQAADPAQAESLRYGTAFDRETGERLDFWSLFTKAEPELRRALVAGAEEPLQDALAAAIEPEHVVFLEEHLEIDFPAGMVEGLDTAYTLSIDYAALDGLLQSWALPGAPG